ncbi:peptidoglycan-binding protein [Lyngbya sp. PCC 8106]|uniref:peptidoglycan-binding domain-containing protein n=1 Tax=Lyngbya sp. (strain PCC 8106) TaxID=313612 RepID=UPI0000EAB5C9|nr:peptidoglycan-binding protein [Lyngbya sp. PCC 8106]EAW36497.1 Peptidoglycan-binding domain 1 [Lyngbya sp. PCC 8106]
MKLAQRSIWVVLSSLLTIGASGGVITTVFPVMAQTNLTRPTLQTGSQGTEVFELQAALKLLGYYTGEVDGVYAESTAEAVSQFQKAANLPVTGVTNSATWDRLFPPEETSSTSTSTANDCVCTSPTASTPENSSTVKASFPVLKLGMRGEAVVGLQERLRAKGFLKGQADGVFGSQTQAAVIAAQEQYKLKPDGVVGSQTWMLILR